MADTSAGQPFDLHTFQPALAAFDEPMITEKAVRDALLRVIPDHAKRFHRLSGYYDNTPTGPQLHRVAGAGITSPSAWQQRYFQEAGLPSRITGADGVARKEVVLENDIGWRIDAGVDLLIGQAPTIHSTADDPERAALIERLIDTVVYVSGGLPMLQTMALVGSIQGSADIILRELSTPSPSTDYEAPFGTFDPADAQPEGYRDKASIALQRARQLRWQLINPATSAIIVDPLQPSKPLAVVNHLEISTPEGDHPTSIIEILGEHHWQRYIDGILNSEGPNAMKELPLVHIQNLPQPFEWDGRSDVEPLICLQDELNTRLSDRANRVTMTAFQMYLGKRIPEFTERTVGPGQMWATDDADATIETFGGDGDCPSERDHIAEIREAMDKVSGISPLVAGVIRDRIGNLTSSVALRVTLMGAIARTQRKRELYGRGLSRMAELALQWLNDTNAFPTEPSERGFRITWPTALPGDEERELSLAQQKLDLGVSPTDVIREVGYTTPSNIEATA